MFEAKERKPPDITQTNSIAKTRHEKITWILPVSSVSIICIILQILLFMFNVLKDFHRSR